MRVRRLIVSCTVGKNVMGKVYKGKIEFDHRRTEMDKFACSVCSRDFSRYYNMKRHIKCLHTDSGEEIINSHPKDNMYGNGEDHSATTITLGHPFAMTISGPSSCGKTTLMLTLLRNNATLIHPPPKRIIWLYRRWQPMYEVMKSSVAPPIEFVKGIPPDMERDHCLDTSIPNLIVMDDLMSVTSKDPRINEIFYADSHHRNASVIAINQNLYYNKDPTQRRNCHYLILFNNPVDKQSIMTLGRQMYPGNAQYFIRHFEEAVSEPYGYLVVDLKTTTPEHLRLRGNALTSETADAKVNTNTSKSMAGNAPSSKTRETSEQPTSVEFIRGTHDSANDDKYSPDSLLKCLNPCEYCGVVFFTESDMNKHRQQEHGEEVPSCDDCGLVFSNEYDMERHRKWCVEAGNRDSEDSDEEPRRKLIKLEDTPDDEPSVTYDALMKNARSRNETEFKIKVKKYVRDGMSEDDAEEKAEEKLKQKDMIGFLNEYATIIKYILNLRGGLIHKKIMDSVNKYSEEGNSERSAIKRALIKYRYRLEEYIEDETEEETESDEDMESDEASEDDMESEELSEDEMESDEDDEEEETEN